MDSEKTTLRSLVDKWLAPTSVRPLRVKRLGRMANGARFVCIEVPRPAEPLTIAFFYHGDGAWRVFPPAAGMLEMAKAY